MSKKYEFQAVIESVPEKGGAYVRFPYDIRKEFGKGRIKVQAAFDGVSYSGSIVNMGVKNEDGSVCYIIGVRKDIREKIGKQPGDTIHVSISVPDAEACTEHKEPPKTIAEYIGQQPESVQPYLEKVNAAIRAALPDAVEKFPGACPHTGRGET